jgi:hypothetical protein
VDWWSEDDAEEYESRVKVMVDQASKFQVHGQSVKGSLTSGENIADLGGLRLALRGLVNSQGFDPNARIDGFTPVQRFFLSWAQCWRQNILEARALQLLTIDPVSLTIYHSDHIPPLTTCAKFLLKSMVPMSCGAMVRCLTFLNSTKRLESQRMIPCSSLLIPGSTSGSGTVASTT